MKNLDLEKVIIIVSLLLMPVAGGWIYMLTSDLKEADNKLASAEKDAKTIHELHADISATKKFLKGAGSVDNERIYFENRAMVSQAEGGALIRTDIRVNEIGRKKVRSGRKDVGEDIEVKVEFQKKSAGRSGLPLPRSFVNAFVFNSEMASPVWKLRNLKITNKDFKGLRSSQPPAAMELSDDWIVEELTFARRKAVEKKANSRRRSKP